jgi:hypothetical protein
MGKTFDGNFDPDCVVGGGSTLPKALKMTQMTAWVDA